MRKAIFLDRDGTINIEKNYLYQIEAFEYTFGLVEALKVLYQAGFLLVVITNQSGIARGYYKESEFGYLMQWMLNDLKERGILIAGIYYCPHHPNGSVKEYTIECECRKPKTGLFWCAAEELHIDMSRSYAIGDKLRDLAICQESKVKGILLGEDKNIDNTVEKIDIWKCNNILEAANKITEYERNLI